MTTSNENHDRAAALESELHDILSHGVNVSRKDPEQWTHFESIVSELAALTVAERLRFALRDERFALRDEQIKVKSLEEGIDQALAYAGANMRIELLRLIERMDVKDVVMFAKLIQIDPETETEAFSEDFVSPDFERHHFLSDVVHCHQFHCLRGQQPFSFPTSALDQHSAEVQIIF